MANKKNMKEEQTQNANAIFEFQFDAYDKHRRGIMWYVGALIVAGGFLLIAIITKNFLFAVIILLVSFIIFIHDLRDPDKHNCKMIDGGMIVDDRFYPYSHFENFWIVYEPPEIKNLYLSMSGITKSHLTIPLGSTDPIEVRRWLRRVIFEDLEQDDEPIYETIARILKI